MSVPAFALEAWRSLAGDPGAFAPGTTVVVRGSRAFARPGWTGVVRLGEAVVVEAGDSDPPRLDALVALPDPLDMAAITAALSPAGSVGPGVLLHLPAPSALLVPAGAGRSETVPTTALADWFAGLPADEVRQSSIADGDEVVVLREAGAPVAAATVLPWPYDIAQLGLLVDPAHRRRGFGAAVAAAAVGAALDRGLQPQWRAHVDNIASVAVARSLGFRVSGGQLGLDLRADGPGG